MPLLRRKSSSVKVQLSIAMVAIFVTRKESLQKLISATTLYCGQSIRVLPRLLSKGCIEGPQPFDFHSAGGDMRVAEERLKAASDIGFRPQNERFCYKQKCHFAGNRCDRVKAGNALLSRGAAMQPNQGCFPIYARIPPSTYSTWPFTKLEASLARNTAGPCRSLVSPQRPAGVLLTMNWSKGWRLPSA